jgi:hypothetical protein
MPAEKVPFPLEILSIQLKTSHFQEIGFVCSKKRIIARPLTADM